MVTPHFVSIWARYLNIMTELDMKHCCHHHWDGETGAQRVCVICPWSYSKDQSWEFQSWNLCTVQAFSICVTLDTLQFSICVQLPHLQNEGINIYVIRLLQRLKNIGSITHLAWDLIYSEYSFNLSSCLSSFCPLKKTYVQRETAPYLSGLAVPLMWNALHLFPITLDFNLP